MQHYSCDICGKDLPTPSETRYTVKVEAFAATDPHELTDDDLDLDPISDTAQLLNDLKPCDTLPPLRQNLQFDLCAICYLKFSLDPLGRENANKFEFSSN